MEELRAAIVKRETALRNMKGKPEVRREGDGLNAERIAAELREMRERMGSLEQEAHKAAEAGKEDAVREMRGQMEELRAAIVKRETALRNMKGKPEVQREGDGLKIAERPVAERPKAEMGENREGKVENRGDAILGEIGGLLRQLHEEVGALRGEVEDLRNQVKELKKGE